MSITILALLLAKIAIGIAMLVAAGVDVAKRIVPNEAVIVVAVSGFLVRLLSRQEPAAWLSVVAAFGVLLAFGLLARLQLIGGGDVKLMAAAVLTVPLYSVLPLILVIAVSGGAVALAYLLYRVLWSSLRPTHGDVVVVTGSGPAISMPYAVAILLGMVSFNVVKVIGCSGVEYCWL